jgi:hypothetical protein
MVSFPEQAASIKIVPEELDAAFVLDKPQPGGYSDTYTHVKIFNEFSGIL